MLTHISLFSGIGGFDIAAEWAGFETILQVEIDPFCQKILKKHWPGVRLIGDIRDVREETIADSKGSRLEGGYDGLQMHQAPNGNRPGQSTGGHSRISLLTGGPPCQPTSLAGKRLGKADDRWLWPETIRVIRLLNPRWVCLENPAGIISLGKSSETVDLESRTFDEISTEYSAALDGICDEIEACGYEVQPVVIPACAVGAWHRRHRVFIIAQLSRLTAGKQADKSATVAGEWQARQGTGRSDRQSPADLPEQVLQGRGEYGERAGECDASASYWQEHWLPAVTRLCRVDDGLPRGVDRTNRLKALGNAVVPQQVYPILKAISEVEINRIEKELK